MSSSNPLKPKPGRPKAGTESERIDYLLDQALKLFICEGFSNTSIAKISAATGVSTRTIYERYTNKGELLLASVSRMVESDVFELINIPNLSEMTLPEGLKVIGEKLLERVMHPDMIAFYRMGVAEAVHLPEISKRMERTFPMRLRGIVAEYLSKHVDPKSLSPFYVEQSAAIFLEMIFAEPRNKALFGLLAADWDPKAHVDFVVELFINGFARSTT